VALTLDESSLVTELELLFKEARRRRRRRWVGGISAVVVAVLVGLVLTIGFPLFPAPTPRPHSSGSLPPVGSTGRTGATLVYAYGNTTSGQLRVIDADSGADRTVPLPAPYGGSSDLAMVNVGTSLVLSRGNHAWLYQSDLLRPPVDLGPSLRVIPGPTADEIWIWSNRCLEGLGCSYSDTEPENGMVQLFDSSGRPIGPPIAVPVDAHWFPTGQVVDSGIILETANGPGRGGAQIWNPILNHVVGTVPDRVIAAQGDVIASAGGTVCPQCVIQVMNLRTGQNRSVRLPDGTSVLGPASISPDGSTLALAVTGAAHGSPPVVDVVVVGLNSGATRELPGSDLGTSSIASGPSLTWSDTGWLFAAGAGRSRIVAWRPGDRTAVVLPSATLPPVRLDPPQFQVEYPSMIAR
jgi:hypothetical protein